MFGDAIPSQTHAPQAPAVPPQAPATKKTRSRNISGVATLIRNIKFADAIGKKIWCGFFREAAIKASDVVVGNNIMVSNVYRGELYNNPVLASTDETNIEFLAENEVDLPLELSDSDTDSDDDEKPHDSVMTMGSIVGIAGFDVFPPCHNLKCFARKLKEANDGTLICKCGKAYSAPSEALCGMRVTVLGKVENTVKEMLFSSNPQKIFWAHLRLCCTAPTLLVVSKRN